MKRAATYVAVIAVVLALAAQGRTYSASFVADLGPEISREALLCSAPDVWILEHVITRPKFWSKYVAPQLASDIHGERVRRGCSVQAGTLQMVSGRYLCEFRVSLGAGGASDFQAIVAGITQSFADTGGISSIVRPKKPNKAPEPTSGTVMPRAEPRVTPVPPVAHL